MAKKRIKGITIKLEGDSTGLEKAISDVDKKLENTTSTLKDVNSLLKFDPKNTVLLEQKQRVLADAINTTKKRVDILREAEAKAKKQMEAGELGKEKYEALQRELIETERKLRGLETQSKNTAKAFENSGGNLEKFSAQAKNAAEKTERVSKAAGVIVAGMAGSVPATQELRRDMSFLEQNARAAGESMEHTTGVFKVFNAVSGETDSSIEGISNLLQAGFKGSKMQQVVEGISGAVTRFPDTLKVESLSDSLQETLATNNATGQFAELLDRLGVGAESFSEELASCANEAERQDLVLRTLADAGLNETYKGWRKNNKELVENENAMMEMQLQIADFAKSIAPIVTDVLEIGSVGVRAFNSLPEPVKRVTTGLTLATAAASPMLNVISKITANTGGLSKATGGLFGVLKGHPYVAVAAGAIGLAGAVFKLAQNTNAETRAAEESARKRQSVVNGIELQNQKTQVYFDKLKALEGVEGKSAGQKQLMKEYVDRLNESVDGLNLTYDDETDKLNLSTEAIRKKMDAQKEAALQAAYLKNSEEALAEYVEKEMELNEVQKNLKAQRKELNELEAKGGELTVEENRRKRQLIDLIGDLEDKQSDLHESMGVLTQDYLKNYNAAQMQGQSWKDLIDEAESLKIKIPEALITALEAGKYEVPTTVEELNNLIAFQKAVDRAGTDGTALVAKLQSKMREGKISTKEATAELTESIKSETGKLPAKGSSDGTRTANAIASALRGGKGNNKSAAAELMQAAKNAANSVDFSGTGKTKSDEIKAGIRYGKSGPRSAAVETMKNARTGAKTVSFESVGRNASSGIATGLELGALVVTGAAKWVMNQALIAAKREAEINSPSRKWGRVLGLGADEGIAKYMKKGAPMVEKASAYTIKAGLNAAEKELNRSKMPEVSLMPFKNAETASSRMVAKGMHAEQNENQKSIGKGDVNVSMTQNNYSPKALSQYEIYRQTKSQIAMLKGTIR